MKRALMIGLPVVVIVLGVLGALAMYQVRPVAETVVPDVHVPVVRVQEIHLQDVRLTVKSQGTVSPRTESTLVSEVSGRVIEVSPSFVSGGFFETGDLLLRIEPDDYQQAVVQARAVVARTELRLAQENAAQEVAIHEWRELREGVPNPLARHDPQVADAQAALQAATAALDQARRDVGRTEIRAPYAGRVRSKDADVGQFVMPGVALGTVYAIDWAEIRLPLPDADLAFLDLPLMYRGEADDMLGPRVVLRAEFAGDTHQWEGRVVRTEGEIDLRSRMVHVVARVPDPYGRGGRPGRPPLAAGLFVDAEILGIEVRSVAIVPRAALRGEDRVLLVDGDDRLRFRTVHVLRRTDRDMVIDAGLEDSDRLCLTPLVAVTDGMQVRTQEP